MKKGVELDITESVALVTGANSPIGLAIASQLAQAGADVIMAVHKNTAEAEALAVKTNSTVLHCDLRNPEEIEDLIDQTFKIKERLDILVNNAALQTVEDLINISYEDWDAIFETNLRSVHLLIKAAVPYLQKSENASIANVSSIEAHQPALGHGHYSASKAALIMLTRSAAFEYGKFGIRVNSVSPGLIDNGDIEKNWPEGSKRWLDSAPLKRLGKPKDVADAILFLSSPLAKWITGSDLIVDGGIMSRPTW